MSKIAYLVVNEDTYPVKESIYSVICKLIIKIFTVFRLNLLINLGSIKYKKFNPICYDSNGTISNIIILSLTIFPSFSTQNIVLFYFLK